MKIQSERKIKEEMKNSNKVKRAVCLTLASVLVCMSTGCGEKKQNGNADLMKGDDFKYPIKTEQTLQYWYVDHSAGQVNRAEIPHTQAIYEATGVKLEYIPVSVSIATEQFNLMLASGEIPDIVQYDWSAIPGGAQAAVNAGQIKILNDYIAEYMPNLKAYLEKDPNADRQAKNDEGNYCFVPSYRGDQQLLTYMGPMVRRDWLEELGLEEPETLEDWEIMLTAFKEKKGATTPFVCNPSYLMMLVGGAHPVSMAGHSDDCYVENGKVHYGPIEEEFKEALKVLNRWYKEGLIDPNIAAVDSTIIDSKMTSGQAGASVGLLGGGLGKWLRNGKSVHEGYDLVGVKYPVVNKGDTPKFGQYDNTMMNTMEAISAKSENAELAARYLDFFFTEEGMVLQNFGKEGEAYDVVDGNRIFKKELIENNMLSDYANYTGGLGVQLWDAYSQSLAFPNQRTAIENWRQTETAKYMMPPVTLTTEESNKVSKIISDIKVYQSEMFYQFLFGTKDIETEFDAYVQQIKKMRIDEVLKCKQAAYDRFINR